MCYARRGQTDDMTEIRQRVDHSPVTSGLLPSVAAGTLAISQCARQSLELDHTPGRNQYGGGVGGANELGH